MTILFVYRSFPEHDTNAGGLRLVEILAILARAGHRLIFLAAETNASKYRTNLEVRGVTCVSDDGHLSCSAWRLRELLQRYRPDAAVFVHFEMFERYGPAVRAFLPACHCIVDTVDVHFLRAFRQTALLGEGQTMGDWQSVRARELRAIRKADSVWTVTRREAELLRGEIAVDGRFHVVPTIHTPNPAVSPRERRKGVVFLGGYHHAPNIDAVHYFMQEIFPRLEQLCPGTSFTIAGSHPPEAFRKYASVSGAVRVAGFVEDHHALLDAHQVGVAPLRFGAGMKGKIGEYFCCGLPCVTTAIGAEGMGLVHEKNVWLAEDAAGFAHGVARLLQDSELWNRLAQNGLAYIREQCSPEAVTPELLAAVRTAAETRPKRGVLLAALFDRVRSPVAWAGVMRAIVRGLHRGGLKGMWANVKVWLHQADEGRR